MKHRLLIVGINWPPETFLYRLIHGLLEVGWEITVVSPVNPKTDRRLHWIPLLLARDSLVSHLTQFLKNSLRILLRLNAKTWMQVTLLRHLNWATWRRLLPFIGRYWDVVYFPWNTVAIEYIPLFDLGMPVIISCRGSQINVAPYDPRRRDLVDGLRQTFACATVVHCVSEDIKQEAQQYGLDPDKTQVIRPAVDPFFFYPSPLSRQIRDVFRVVTTGTLIWVKGYEYALSAIRQLVDQSIPVRFEILGDGPERQRVLYTIHDLGLEQHVFVRGRVTPEQVRATLQHADAFLLASLSEGISNAVLEAMACAVPVVTTDCGGMREAVTDGIEGLVVPVRDVTAMSEALGRLWHDPALREQMGRAGRIRIECDFSLTQQIRAFATLLEQVSTENYTAS